MAENETMKENFLNWLRGDYKSIKMRFFKVPENYLSYWYSSIFGKSYTEYYAKRMDSEARKSKKNKHKTSQRYLDNGKIQFDYLVDHGLQPHHSVLDYGCGILRAGMYFIDYLDANKYTGIEISEERLNKGIGLATEKGIPRDSYQATVVTDATAHELGEATFDYIVAYSVFSHMPLDECETALRAMDRMLAPGGKLFVTYSEADDYRRFRFKDFWFTRDQFLKIVDATGFSASIAPNWTEQHEEVETTDIVMALLTRKSES